MVGLAMICVSEQERICGCDRLFMYLAGFSQHSIKLRTSREQVSSKAAKRERDRERRRKKNTQASLRRSRVECSFPVSSCNMAVRLVSSKFLQTESYEVDCSSVATCSGLSSTVLASYSIDYGHVRFFFADWMEPTTTTAELDNNQN